MPRIIIALFLFYPAIGMAQTDSIEIKTNNERIEVSISEDLFTAYNFKETAKPFLYPVFGPKQLRMTRDFPMKETEGEANDHPHHKSLWIGHEVNGVDFWTCKEGAKIVVEGEPTINLKSNTITANSKWIDSAGKTTCSDTTKWTFGFDDQSRWIDCEFKLTASEAPITINDT